MVRFPDRLENLPYGDAVHSAVAVCGLQSCITQKDINFLHLCVFVSWWLNKNKPQSHKDTKGIFSQQAEKPPYHRPRSTVHRPSSSRSLPSAVRGLYSFIRSPFVDGLPFRQAYPLPPSTVYHPPSTPRSAIRRLRSPFVYSFPHSLTAYNPTGWKAWSPAVCRPPSVVSIRLFVPHSLTVFPPPHQPGNPCYCRPPSISPLPSAVCGLPSFPGKIQLPCVP
jgi:hypothetical protein